MDEESQKTLLRIEQNNDALTTLCIGRAHSSIYNNDDNDDGDNNDNKGRFMSSFDDNFLRLGEGIRQSTHITKLQVDVSHIDRKEWVGDINSSFHKGLCEGIQQNASINELILRCDGSSIFSVGHTSVGSSILEVYQTNNNLTDLCIFNAPLLIGSGGDQIIATTLQCCTNLRTINLYQCSISAGMLSPIVEAIRGLRSLENLYLIGNRVQNAGCEALATLLNDPNSNITTLQLQGNGIGNLGVIAIANSLANNTKLQSLYFDDNHINRRVEGVFCIVLCMITSSISSIFSSNHTLADLHFPNIIQHTNLIRLLQLNKDYNKRHVIMKKILQYHPHIDMNPLFGWDMEGEWTLKGLPYIIDWFNRAAVAVNDRGTRRVARAKDRVNYNVDQKKLSAIYEFAKAMPSLFIPTSHTTVDEDDNKKKRKRG